MTHLRSAQDRYHVDRYDREQVVEQVHEGCLQAHFRVLSDDRERRENYRECRAEVGADDDRIYLRRGQDACSGEGDQDRRGDMVEDWVRTVTAMPEAMAR